MPEDVFFNKELKIIEVRSYGVVSREDLAASIESIKVLVEKTDINKVLVETAEEKSLPKISDLEDFGATIPIYLKVAIVVTDEQVTARDLKFIGEVAYIKGTQIREFASREEAMKWLNL